MKLGTFPFPGAGANPASLVVDHDPAGFVGDSDAFRYMRFRMEQVAATPVTVLLLGETGTGKSMAAHLMHSLSPRADGRFIAVDCASLPATLIESELFGREKGAFTDARSTQVGRFELAHGGTIFLDEIGELSPEAQAKLLRVLQHGEFERLGHPRTIHVDVRVIVATNRDLVDEVKAGRFRRDLFYRLNIFPITMPPLRERRSDIPILTQQIVKRLQAKHQHRIDTIPRAVIETLAAHDWPGNVRELENVLERAVITTPDSTLRLSEPLPADLFEAPPSAPTTRLADVERSHILRVLHGSGWRIEGPHGAASALGLKPSTLRSRMRKLGVNRAPSVTAGVASQVA
jgi:transcriptional regulator with GAF, ATPase, and Fis domain